MTVTSNGLTRASAVCAIAAGAVFIGVQIGHPDLSVESIQTTEVYIRDQLKILMAILALVGISGMYLSQIRRNGVLGLVGYVILALGYLFIMAGVFAAAYVYPEIAKTSPGFIRDYIAVDTARGSVKDGIGALETVTRLQGAAYLLGGLLFGIALFRARVLARWGALLLAVGGLASVALALMPDAFYRLIALPNGIALIGLGFSLWRATGSRVAADAPSPVASSMTSSAPAAPAT